MAARWLGKLAVAGITFFFIDEKERKIQDKPGPSGRFVGLLRAWVDTVLAAIGLVVIVEFNEGSSLRSG